MKLKKLSLGTVSFLSVLFSLTVMAQSIPQVITFQSALFDDAGNLIADDNVDILFRVLDDQGTELYSEEQKGVHVFDGLVNVLIGSGVEPGSDPAVPTGGLPYSVLNPITPLFIEVSVGSITTLEQLELTSVPYAYYCQEALTVAENSITSTMIQQGAITNEHVENVMITTTQLPGEVALDSEVASEVSSLQSDLNEKLNRDGSDSMTGSLNMGGNNVTNVASVDGVNVSNLNDVVVNNHETRITALEGSDPRLNVNAWAYVTDGSGTAGSKTLSDSVNFSSVTRILGDATYGDHYRLVYSASMQNSTYAAIATVNDNSGGRRMFAVVLSKDSNSVRVRLKEESGGQGYGNFSIMILGGIN